MTDYDEKYKQCIMGTYDGYSKVVSIEELKKRRDRIGEMVELNEFIENIKEMMY